MSAERTTIGLTRSTHSRLSELKPYDSMSFDEFVGELADHYERKAE